MHPTTSRLPVQEKGRRKTPTRIACPADNSDKENNDIGYPQRLGKGKELDSSETEGAPPRKKRRLWRESSRVLQVRVNPISIPFVVYDDVTNLNGQPHIFQVDWHSSPTPIDVSELRRFFAITFARQFPDIDTERTYDVLFFTQQRPEDCTSAPDLGRIDVFVPMLQPYHSLALYEQPYCFVWVFSNTLPNESLYQAGLPTVELRSTVLPDSGFVESITSVQDETPNTLVPHSTDDDDKAPELVEEQTVLVDSEPARRNRQSDLDLNDDFVEQARRTALPCVCESCALDLKEPETITRWILDHVEMHLGSQSTRMIQRTSENTFQHLVVFDLTNHRILAVEELELHDPTSKWRAHKATDKVYADIFLPKQALLAELKSATPDAILRGVCGPKKHAYSKQAALEKLDAVLKTMDLTPTRSRAEAHVWKDAESCPDKFFTPDQFEALQWKDLRVPVHNREESYLTLDSLWHEAHEQNEDYWKVIGVGGTPGRDSVYVSDSRVRWSELPGSDTRSGYRSVMLLVGGRRVVHDTERVEGMQIVYSRA